jgi:hypothetical protein
MNPSFSYRKKPIVIQAAVWEKNGDHPKDYSEAMLGLENDEMKVFSPAECEAKKWEGQVVRYFRHPDIGGQVNCKHCNAHMHDHGWIDTLEGGHIVCPGDMVITGVAGEFYPCKPKIFAATYELVA